MAYTPQNPPALQNEELRILSVWLQSELTRIGSAFSAVDSVILELVSVEPTRRIDGMLVYANGTNWNPGSGKGFYRWEEGSGLWKFLG